MTERRERGWLPEGRSNPPRRGVLEDTLFRRLEEMRKKPPGELFELLERTLDVLRATKEALLEQRREIRSLATAVDTLRARVDQLVQHRPEPRRTEPEPEPEPAYAEYVHDAEPEPPVEPEPEAAEPEPVPEPEPATEPEPEPDLLPAADSTPDGYGNDGYGTDTVEEPVESAFDFAERRKPRADGRARADALDGRRLPDRDRGRRPSRRRPSRSTASSSWFPAAWRSPFPGDTRTAYFATRSDPPARYR